MIEKRGHSAKTGTPERRRRRASGIIAAVAAIALGAAGCSASKYGAEPHPKAPCELSLPAGAQHAGNYIPALFFSSNRTGEYKVYEKPLVARAVAKIKAKLLPNQTGGNNMNAEVSPNGRAMVYYSDLNGHSATQVEERNLQTDHTTQLTHVRLPGYAGDPDFTSGGRIVYKEASAKTFGRTWKMCLNGADQHPLAATSSGTEQYKPAPEGANQVIISVRQIHGDSNSDVLGLENTRTNSVHYLPHHNGISDWYATKPDPANPHVFAFVSKPRPGAHDAIYTEHFDGTDQTRVSPKTVQGEGDCDDPSWAPKGYLTFVCNIGRGYDVEEENPATHHVWPIDRGPAGSNDLSPAIAYVPRSAA